MIAVLSAGVFGGNPKRNLSATSDRPACALAHRGEQVFSFVFGHILWIVGSFVVSGDSATGRRAETGSGTWHPDVGIGPSPACAGAPAGETRYKAALSLGLTLAPVVTIPARQARAFRVIERIANRRCYFLLGPWFHRGEPVALIPE